MKTQRSSMSKRATAAVFAVMMVVCLELAACQTTTTPCTCDLTPGACEVRCCCDPDCSEADVATFDTCLDTRFSAVDRRCASGQTLFANELEAGATVAQVGDLFCVTRDNWADINFYNQPACIALGTCNDQLPPLADGASSSPFADTFHQSGEPMYAFVVATNATSWFALPAASASSNLCRSGAGEPLRYLTDASTVCAREVTDLAAECAARPSLQARAYFDGVQLFAAPRVASSLSSIATTCVNDNVAVDCGVTPVLSGGACTNVVSSVRYTVTTDGVFGIRAVSAAIALRNVTQADFPLAQRFEAVFASSDATATQSTYAPNTGYFPGVAISTTDGYELSLPDSSQSCGATRRAAAFRQDARTGCALTVAPSETCASLQSRALVALKGADFPTTASIPSARSDAGAGTVPLLVDADPTTTNATVGEAACTMAVGAHYRVVFAASGDVANPRQLIAGVRWSYDTRSVRFRCSGASCATMTLELAASVTFTDHSQTEASSTEAPGDDRDSFFFPLFVYESSVRGREPNLGVIVPISAVVLFVVFVYVYLFYE